MNDKLVTTETEIEGVTLDDTALATDAERDQFHKHDCIRRGWRVTRWKHCTLKNEVAQCLTEMCSVDYSSALDAPELAIVSYDAYVKFGWLAIEWQHPKHGTVRGGQHRER